MTNKKSDFYLVGLAGVGEFRQVFLAPKLHGLASELESEVIKPKIFVQSLLRVVWEE